MYINPALDYIFEDCVYADHKTVLPTVSAEDLQIMRELNVEWAECHPGKHRAPLFDFSRVDGKGFEAENTGMAATLPKNETAKKLLLESLKKEFGERVEVAGNVAVILGSAPLAVRPTPELAETAENSDTDALFHWVSTLEFVGSGKEQRLANFVLSNPSSIIQRGKNLYAVARKTAVATFWATVKCNKIDDFTASFAGVK